MKSKIILIFIILLAALLRIVLLAENPPSLNWDEVSHGYNSYSILKTGGYDEWDAFLPLTNFRAYGDYPLPLNLYLTMPFVALFGLSEVAIRLPHALLGVGVVILTWFLTKKLTNNQSTSFLASFIVATSPWHIFTSRSVLQANIAVFFLVASVVVFLYREKNKYLLPLSFLFLGLTLFSYHSTRIFSPLFLLVIFAINYRELWHKFVRQKTVSVLIVIILISFFGSLPFILSQPQARARAGIVFLLNDSAIYQIETARNNSIYSPEVTRLLHNRPVYFLKEFAKNYSEYFSPNFLFFEGGTQYQFSVPNHGLFYFVYMPFFYLGFLLLIMYAFKGSKEAQLILAWMIIAPIPASITNEKYAVVRAMTMLPLPGVFIAVGLTRVAKALKKHRSIFILALVAVSLLFLERYLNIYFGEYRKNYSWAWQYGYKQVVTYANANYEKYDKIIVSKKYGEPHEFFLFFWPWDPTKYKTDPNLVRFNQSNWWWVDRFDKFYFVNDWDVFKLESGSEISCEEAKCLLITSPSNAPHDWLKLETINFLDGKPAFEIYQNHKYEN